MREKRRGHRNSRPTFARLNGALWASVEEPALKIEVRPPNLPLKRGLNYHAGAAAGVDADKDEASDMSLRPLAAVRLFEPPRGSYQLGDLIARQPSLPRRTLRRQDDFDRSVVQTFAKMVIDRGAQILKIVSGGAFRILGVGIIAAQLAVYVR